MSTTRNQAGNQGRTPGWRETRAVTPDVAGPQGSTEAARLADWMDALAVLSSRDDPWFAQQCANRAEFWRDRSAGLKAIGE